MSPLRRRPDFPPPAVPMPPISETLQASVAALPDAPGVYTFHAEAEDQPPSLPLYIGKSVRLRSRVLAHLRNPDETRLIRQTARISYQRTAGEVGALLLEAQLIKQQQPLFNQKLRRTRQLCALQWQGDQPVVVHAKDLDFASAPELYGLYGSRHAALAGLRELAERERLCEVALGLEKPTAGRPCFRAMLGRCAGWCQGRESDADHQARLRQALQALRVACWPFPGAVGLVELGPPPDARHAEVPGPRWRQIHVLRNWCYLGTVTQKAQARQLGRQVAGFDADGYRILCGPLLRGEATLIPLD